MTKILVIEQDKFFGDLITNKLKESGFESLVVNSGTIALDQIRNYTPDLVILDMELASPDPISLLQQKHDDDTISPIPTIIISRSGDFAEVKDVIDLGVKDYLVKAQLNLDELIAKIKVHVKTADGSVAKGILKGRVVMWVEDDQFLSDLISRKLSSQECRLVYARTGEEALKTLETEKPDIIILDLLLPGISGFDVLEKIKLDDRLKEIPVVILSNFSQNNEMDRAKKLGSKRFLIKASIVLDDLVREIKSVLDEGSAA